jgi:hypothetical protein
MKVQDNQVLEEKFLRDHKQERKSKGIKLLEVPNSKTTRGMTNTKAIKVII